MTVRELEWGVATEIEHTAAVLDIIGEYKFVRHVQFKLPGEPYEAKHLSRIQNAAKQVKDRGYSLSVHAYPHINLCENVDTLIKANLELAQKALKLCFDVGGEFAVFHGGSVQGRGNPETLRCRARAFLTDSLERLLEHAENYNIPVHLENIYPAPFRSELVRLPGSKEDYTYLCDMINHDLLRFCYDYGHGMIASREEDKPPLELTGSFHLHENDGLNDLHLPIGCAEEGIDWSDELNKLALKNFKGAVILENSYKQLKTALEGVNFIIECGQTEKGVCL